MISYAGQSRLDHTCNISVYLSLLFRTDDTLPGKNLVNEMALVHYDRDTQVEGEFVSMITDHIVDGKLTCTHLLHVLQLLSWTGPESAMRPGLIFWLPYGGLKNRCMCGVELR